MPDRESQTVAAGHTVRGLAGSHMIVAQLPKGTHSPQHVPATARTWPAGQRPGSERHVTALGLHS